MHNTVRLSLVFCVLALFFGISGLSALAQDSAPLVTSPNQGSASSADLFATAVILYDSSRYDSAIALWEVVRSRDDVSAALYYNLGNGYFERGDIGRAILNYLRAKRLDPADQDINDNLSFAKGFVKLQMEGVELNPLAATMATLTSQRSLSWWGWLSSILLLLLSITLSVRILGWGPRLSILVALTVQIVALATAITLTTFKYQTEFAVQRGTLVQDDVAVTSKPTATAEVEFRSAVGLEVEIREREHNRYLVTFANKRQGWVPISAVETL